MRFKISISLLSIFIAITSLIASLFGLLTKQGPGEHSIQSFRGQEEILIYGRGLYQNEPLSGAVQVLAQDFVTILVGIPMLLLSVYFFRKGSIKGQLLLTGTLGYFLYTYTSYSFLLMFNPFFLVYVALMSASLFAFVLAMMSFDLNNLSSYFKPKLPTRLIGGFLITFGVLILLMWLGRIIPALMDGTTPVGLDIYTTLVIQALDLGLIVPAAILSGVLVIKKKPFGYLLAPVIIIKGFTLATAVTVMAINMIRTGVQGSNVEFIIFAIINLLFIFLLVLVLKNVIEPPCSTGKVDHYTVP